MSLWINIRPWLIRHGARSSSCSPSTASCRATQISDQFPISAPAISQHLKVLRQARLVQVEKQAQQRIYRIDPEALLELEQWASRVRRLWNQRFDALEKILEEETRKGEQ